MSLPHAFTTASEVTYHLRSSLQWYHPLHIVWLSYQGQSLLRQSHSPGRLRLRRRCYRTNGLYFFFSSLSQTDCRYKRREWNLPTVSWVLRNMRDLHKDLIPGWRWERNLFFGQTWILVGHADDNCRHFVVGCHYVWILNRWRLRK
jgi:hypothetical protein